ncbi:MAG: YkgJ family cysteine cluster protein [Candidatus Hodarchaeota archaeon]
MIDFLQFCIKCKDSNCCSQPYYGFSRENEKKRILNHFKDKVSNINEKSIFKICRSKFEKGVCYAVIKKDKMGKCIFLDENLACTIQDIKPFDCTLWPLTIDYDTTTDSVDVYLGAECLAGQELEKKNQLGEWIESQKERLTNFVNDLSLRELFCYSSMDDIPNPKYLFTIQRRIL